MPFEAKIYWKLEVENADMFHCGTAVMEPDRIGGGLEPSPVWFWCAHTGLATGPIEWQHRCGARTP